MYRTVVDSTVEKSSQISLKQVAGSACAIILAVSFCTQNLSNVKQTTKNRDEVRFVSASVSSPLVYNSGNISFYLDGIPVMNDQLRNNYKRIAEIAALHDNWNENGAEHFSKELIEKLWTIVDTVKVQPLILPTARDSVQLEYEKENGDYLEFEVFESGKIKKFFYGHDNIAKTEYIELEMISEAVDQFYGFGV